eukprot:TRINITY_DN4615_c0_g1_i1.p1 TRINITY_DN4615_c0_g1~~TRINITY_DN4615_c0_g1_i1.p1  ORF type:complete len:201 (-),score=10.87 TRINITY_DN4615_c0_g1_i1:399-1001(-)
MAMRLGRLMRSAEHLSSYSEVGNFSTFSFRQRYTILLKNQTDPTIADFFYEKWLHAWVGDAPSYNFWFVTSFAMGCMVGILSRHWFFNPDLYGRRQEFKKPLPDRHRQWSYSIPYYNHRLRNCVTKYKWCLIDNEPDYNDNIPSGIRPNRKPIHRRPYMWIFSIPRYNIEDPLYTSCLHANMNEIYEEIGYTRSTAVEED